MNFTRREMLQGISAGAIGIAANSSLPGAKAIWTTSESSVPWPKPMGDPVIESLRPVIEHSRDVHTHYEKIVEVAGWLAYEDLPLAEFSRAIWHGEDAGCCDRFHHGGHGDRYGFHRLQDACEVSDGLCG